ncbi:MAG: glycosyltransferase family 2 protein [Rickettsiales bacterium]|nr:glycosyltransferase family 2 protein [Rickettsiales bacterium]
MVSVIIPNYNNARYLTDCINSVRAQTFRDLELVIIDDASTDDSWELILSLAAKDDRILCHRLDRNGGVGNARNRGIEFSKGDFIMFLDADDMLHPTAIEGMTTIQDATGADMVVGNYTKVPGRFRIPDNANFLPPTFSFDSYAEPDVFTGAIDNLALVTVWGKLIKRETINGLRFRTDIYPYEDVEFMLRLYAKVQCGAITCNMAIYYRSSATSVIADKNRDVSGDVIGVMNSFAAFVKTPDNGGEKYAAFVKKYAYMFLRLYIGNVMRKIQSRPGKMYAQYRKDLWRQLRTVARAVRKLLPTGSFNGINITFGHRVALCLFALGFIKSAGGAIALVFTDAKI